MAAEIFIEIKRPKHRACRSRITGRAVVALVSTIYFRFFSLCVLLLSLIHEGWVFYPLCLSFKDDGEVLRTQERVHYSHGSYPALVTTVWVISLQLSYSSNGDPQDACSLNARRCLLHRRSGFWLKPLLLVNMIMLLLEMIMYCTFLIKLFTCNGITIFLHLFYSSSFP